MTSSIKLEGDVLIKAERMLQDVCKTLEKCGVQFCIDGGTLLGIHRENRLLPWDNDMDLYADRKQTMRFILSAMALTIKGYRINLKRVKEDLPPLKKGDLRLIKIRKRLGEGKGNYLLIDLIIKSNFGDRTYWTVGSQKPVLKSVESKFYAKFESIQFKGQAYPTPNDLNNYLTARYGDWKKQVKDWDYLRDDRAITN